MANFIRDIGKKIILQFTGKKYGDHAVRSEVEPTQRNSRVVWWKPMSGMVVAAVLGLLAVWGLQEYRELTALNTEMAASFDLYQNVEIRLIKSIDVQKLNMNPDIERDLEEIAESQKLLKKALRFAPEDKKEWVYNALIESYELKIQLLEKIIYSDNLKRENINMKGASL